jgi:sulfatase modifying factor 1
MVRIVRQVLMVLVGPLVAVDPSEAQDIDRLQAGVVKITSTSEGVRRVGAGFIVRLEPDLAYIVTSAHVVVGDPAPRVEFFTRRNIPATAEVVGLEGDDPLRGLALLHVRGKGSVPAGIAALSLESAGSVTAGEQIVAIGFPRSAGSWHVTVGNVGSRRGRDIYFSPLVDEGNSGGPIIKNGKVIGLIAGGHQSIGQAVTANHVKDFIVGFEVTAQESIPTSPLKSPPASIPVPKIREAVESREIKSRDGAPIVLIPAGEFPMGSSTGREFEKPVHRVSLDAFYLDKYEVTNQRFQKFVQETGHVTTAEKDGMGRILRPDGKWTDPSGVWVEVSGANWRKPEGGETVFMDNRAAHPVVSVSWYDAEAYCRYYGKRLPTEAEWEYAVRAGTSTRYWWGTSSPDSPQPGNIRDKAFKQLLPEMRVVEGPSDGYARTAPVGSFDPNPWDLHDMSGNVSEWTTDWYDKEYYVMSPRHNPTGPSTGEHRVHRGAAWISGPNEQASEIRFSAKPESRNPGLGFRCALNAPP